MLTMSALPEITPVHIPAPVFKVVVEVPKVQLNKDIEWLAEIDEKKYKYRQFTSWMYILPEFTPELAGEFDYFLSSDQLLYVGLFFETNPEGRTGMAIVFVTKNSRSVKNTLLNFRLPPGFLFPKRAGVSMPDMIKFLKGRENIDGYTRVFYEMRRSAYIMKGRKFDPEYMKCDEKWIYTLSNTFTLEDPETE